MSDRSVPIFFRGPTPDQFYFIYSNHWVVYEDVRNGVVVGLRRKTYTWWRLAVMYLAMPVVIAIIGTVFFLFVPQLSALLGILIAGLGATIPNLYIQWTEQSRLARLPRDPFVLRDDGSVAILGRRYRSDEFSSIEFHCTLAESSGAQGDFGHSELEVLVHDGEECQQFNLLAQTSNWAQKHAKKLADISKFKLGTTITSKH